MIEWLTSFELPTIGWLALVALALQAGAALALAWLGDPPPLAAARAAATSSRAAFAAMLRVERSPAAAHAAAHAVAARLLRRAAAVCHGMQTACGISIR